MKAHTEPLTVDALATLQCSGERGTLLLVVSTIQPDWLKAAEDYADGVNLVEVMPSNFLPAGTWYSFVA